MVVTGVALLAAVVVTVGARAAFRADIDETCANRAFTCSVATNFISSFLLAAVVSVVWIGVFGQRRALRRYWRRLTTDPAALLDLPVSLSADQTFQRAALKSAVFDELRSRARHEPLVIEGDSGTGKSVTLCDIARDLTERRLVPIVATLRASPLTSSFEEQMRSVFTSVVDPFMWSSDQTDRVWRRLRRSSRLVFLLDGLDEAVLPDAPLAAEITVQRFFHGLGHLGRAVVTCRPHVVPRSARCSRYTLPELDEPQVLQLVAHRTGPIERGISDDARRALAFTKAGQCPLFADMIGRVLERDGTVGALPGSVDQARIAVLDRAHAIVPDDLRVALGQLALELLRRGRYEAPLSTLPGPAPGHGVSLSYDQLEHARELDLVRTREVAREDVVRFGHPLLIAYFASLTLAEFEQVDEMVGSQLPEAHQAIVWAALRNGAESLITRLTAAGSMKGNPAVDIVRICGAAEFGLPERVGKWITEGELPTTALQHQLIGVATTTQQPWRIDLLLSLQERSGDYGVRWGSARALSEIGPNDAVGRWAEARSVEIVEARDVERGLLLQEGLLWFGPSVAEGGDLPDDHWLAAAAAEVRRASELDLPGALGAESSLAQGLKLAALLGRPVDVALFEQIIGQARFWFARLEAALAVGSLAAAKAATPAGPRLAQLASQDPHPLVRAAGRLAIRSWQTGTAQGLVWLNEHSAVNEPVNDLEAEATLLLADTAVLLNLSNKGSQLQRDLNGRRSELPVCLARQQHRRSLIEGPCVEGCAFDLCPYERKSSNRWSRGVFPEAFCRTVRHAVEEIGPPPWFHGSAGSYVVFWRDQEEEGHTHDATRSGP